MLGFAGAEKLKAKSGRLVARQCTTLGCDCASLVETWLKVVCDLTLTSVQVLAEWDVVTSTIFPHDSL
jgi:hypothetical protein